MPIGETLAQARQRAGLTVAQVSEQTRIREAVIGRIEAGDYSACGGDFYARANIRSIAKAVGADWRPLIAEYDAAYRAPGALAAVSLQELLTRSAPAPPRRRPDPSAVAGLMAAGYASVRRRAGSRVAREPAAPAYRPPGRWVNWIVVLGLVGVLGFGVYSRFSGPRQVAAAPPAAGKHAVTHQRPGHGAPGPVPTSTHAAVAPAPVATGIQAAAAPAPDSAPGTGSAQTPAPAGAGAPGPGGGFSANHRASEGNSAIGGNSAAGPAHGQAPHRPLARPAHVQGPASGQAPPAHGHGRPDHHRKRCARTSAGCRKARPASSQPQRSDPHS